MKILVFDRDENLKGPLKNILLAVHTEEIHGDNILNIRTTDYLEKGYRLAYKDKYGIWHEFIVKGLQETHAVTEPVIDAYCEASFYELLGDYIEDKRPQDVPANTALARALEGTRWEVGFVDDLGSNTTNFYHISAMEAVYKVAEVWGGEIKPRIVVAGNKITHRYIDLLTRRGADRGKRFEFGKDISDIARYVQDDDIKTALYGYGMGEILENGEYGRRIDFAELNDGKAYVEDLEAKEIWGRLNPDGTRSHVFGKVEFDAIEDPQELLEATIEELEKWSQPQISYEATVTDLKAYGYDHEGIELGDTVAVIDRGFPRELRIKARCIRYARDLIDETNNKITLGNFLPNFIDGELDQQRRLENIMARQGIWDRAKIIDSDGTINAQFINNIVDELNQKMNSQGGYVYVSEDGKGLITYDKPIDQDPTMAIQLLGGAFRIANSKLPNGEFDWRTFGTGGGFTADEFVAGVLRGGKVHFDLTNGTFLIGNSTEDYNFYFDGTTLKVRLGTGKTIEESLEDVDEAIQNAQGTADQANSKADGLQDDLIEYIDTTATAEELGEVLGALRDYKEMLDINDAEVENAKLEIADLLERVPAVELQLGEFIQSWIFLDTYVRMGEEGLLIQEINGQTGIRITTDRIDFLDGSGEPVAYITNQVMRINRGIFVDSAQIGEHKIETIDNGHTVFTWMG